MCAMNVEDYVSSLIKKRQILATQVALLQQEILDVDREIEHMKNRKEPEARSPLAILHEDVWEVILKKLGPEDLLNLCQTSSQFQYIIEDRLKLNKASLLIEKVFPFVVPYLHRSDLRRCSRLAKKWRLLVALNWYRIETTHRWSSSVDFTSIQKLIRFLHQSPRAPTTFFIGRAVTFDCVEDITGRFWEVAVNLLTIYGEFICHLELQDYPDRSPLRYYEITYLCLGNLPNLQSINIAWGVDSEDIRSTERFEIAEYCRTHSFPHHDHLKQLTLHLGMPDFQAGPPTDFLLRLYSSQLDKLTINVDEDTNLNLDFSRLTELSFGEVMPIQEFPSLVNTNFPKLKRLTFRYNPKFEPETYFRFLSQLTSLRHLTITCFSVTRVYGWTRKSAANSPDKIMEGWANVWDVLPKLQVFSLSPVQVIRDKMMAKVNHFDDGDSWQVLERLL